MENKYSSNQPIKTYVLFLLLFSFSTINAGEYFLRAITTGTRNWTDSATWSTVSSASATNTGTYPQAGDAVFYNGSSAINIPLNITVDSECFSFSNLCTGSASNITITISSGKTLTISNNFEISGVSDIIKNTTLVGTGTLVVNGDINIGTAGITTTTTSKYTKISFNGPNINLSGNLNMYNIVNSTLGQGAYVSHSAGKFTLTGTGSNGYMNSYQPATGLSINNKYLTENGSAEIEFQHVGDCPIYTEQGITNAPEFTATGTKITYAGSGSGSVIYGNSYNYLNLNNPAGYTTIPSTNVTITSRMDMIAGNLNIGTSTTFALNANTQMNISSGTGVTGTGNRFRYNGPVDVTYSGSVTKAGIELRTGTAFTGSGTTPTRLNSLTITGTTNFDLGTNVGRNSSSLTSTSLWILNSLSINDVDFICNMPTINVPNITVAGGTTTFNGNLGNVNSLTINGNTTLMTNLFTNTLELGANLVNPGFIETTILNVTNNSTLDNDGTGFILVLDLLSVASGAVLDTGGEIILYSDESTTARVAPVEAGAIVGDVTVQRYLINSERRWRLLTAPVKGATNNSIYYNWQNNGNYDGLTGTDVWGPVASYDPSSNGMNYLPISTHSFRKYNNGSWSNVNNTFTELLFSGTKNNAFLTFIIYPYGEGVSGNDGVPGSLNTTLQAKGNLITGNQTYSMVAGNYQLIGNPYASPIDMESLIMSGGLNENVVDEKIWIIDPNIGQYGGYVTWDPVNQYSASGALNATEDNHLIQSGQAFFVKTKASPSSTTFRINESFKRDVANSQVFARTTNTVYERLRVSLERIENSTSHYKDGIVVAFYDGASNNVDEKDVEKFTNPNETLAFLNGTSNISSEHRAPIAHGDELLIKVTRAVAGAYKLKIKTENFSFSGGALFYDLKLGSITQMPIDGSIFEYAFDVTSDATTQGNRFKIVFDTTLGIDDNNNTQNITIYPNPTSKSDGITLNLGKLDFGTYSYRIVNMLGQELQNGDITNQEINHQLKINFNTALNAGVYSFEILDKNKTIKTFKILIN
ncbi:T9SS type A sorting domain-containing protein [Flavobacterium sp.]|uniref:T9SS type A sorting domain-containing protein n=1 Tax=Flavobacterium sp. TaxID=239 RepID=UPI0040487B46